MSLPECKCTNLKSYWFEMKNGEILVCQKVKHHGVREELKVPLAKLIEEAEIFKRLIKASNVY